jgi:EmrB/QacA subfamily drug resistance transporter
VVAVPEFSRNQRLAVLVVSCLSLFMIGLDDTIVSMALPTIARGFNASVSGLQWIFDSYTVVLASLLILGGSTADRFGRRRVFQVGLTVFTASSALCSLAPGLGWLIAFRVLQAVGGSMLTPVAVSMISSFYTRAAQRARAISIWAGMFGLGMALGPSVGGALVSVAGWPGVFWVNVPVGLGAIALTARFVPESRVPVPRRLDPVAHALVVVSLGSLVYAIIEGAYTHWQATTTRAEFAVAALTLAALAAWEFRRPDPLIDLRYFRNRSFTAAVLIAVFAFADMGGFLFLIGIYLQDARGSSAIHAGLDMLPTAAAMAVCPSLAAWVTAKVGSARPPLLLGGAALMLGTYAMSRFTGTTPDTYLWTTLALFGIGMGMLNGQITVAAVSGMPPSHAGLASGIASASRQVGQTLGIAITGSLLTTAAGGRGQPATAVASHPAWHLLFWWAFAVAVFGLFTARAPARHRKTRRPLYRRLLARRPPPLALVPGQQAAPRVPAAEPADLWAPRLTRKAGSLPALQPGRAFPGDPEW